MSSRKPTTEEDFTEKLQSLILGANENGIDLEGGWDCRNGGDGHPDWDILITEVKKSDDSTSQ